MRRSLCVLSVGTVLAASVATAFAQPGTIPPVRQAPVEVETTIPGSASGMDGDVIGDRAWLSPTALTQPAGALAVSFYQPSAPIGVASATYGATDRLHVTGMVGFSYGGNDGDGVYLLTGKYRLLDEGMIHVAVQGGASWIDEATIGTVGIVGTACLDPGCVSMLSGYLGTAFDTEDNDDAVIFASASLIAGTQPLKVVVEIDTVTIENEDDRGILGFAGIRLTSGTWAGDLGLASTLSDDDDILPMMSLTYRGQ